MDDRQLCTKHADRYAAIRVSLFVKLGICRRLLVLYTRCHRSGNCQSYLISNSGPSTSRV